MLRPRAIAQFPTGRRMTRRRRLVVGMSVFGLAFAQAVVMMSEGQRVLGAGLGVLIAMTAFATWRAAIWQAQSSGVASARTERERPHRGRGLPE
jgi:hypothetical protein